MGASRNRSSTSEKSASSGEEKKKERREERTKSEDRGRQKQSLAVYVEDSLGRKTLQNMRSITAQAFARTSGVKVSVANDFIQSLESKGVLTRVGGYSGHRVYKLIKQE